MPNQNQLSRRERQIMDILYALGKATTEDIRREMEDPPTGNAVRTFLQILEAKGHLRRIKAGKEYICEPTKNRARAGIQAFQHVLETFYEGSIERALTAHLTRKRTELTQSEYDRLRQLIDDAGKKEE